MRVITGAFVGATGGFLTFVAALLLAWSVCGWDEMCTDGARRTADVVACLAGLCGLVVMALVYGGLLRLMRRSRPWLVVVPSVVLSAVPALIPGIWELTWWPCLPAVAFAAAGVITGFETSQT
jgi:hypothetical protein